MSLLVSFLNKEVSFLRVFALIDLSRHIALNLAHGLMVEEKNKQFCNTI
jgi:hypothetical protein